MYFITSKDNSSIKEVKKLREKKYRAENGKFIIEGFRFLEEGLKSNFNIDKILVKESVLNKFQDRYEEYLSAYDERILVVSDNIFKSVAGTENSQGVLATVYIKEENNTFSDGLYILVDKVQDPGNLGTVIRTAHSAGCVGVILTKDTVDVYNEKTLRSTMGSIFNVNIIHDEDLSFTKTLLEKKFSLVCSSLQTDMNFYKIDLVRNTIIAVGNEGNGISEEVMDMATIKVKIPMIGSTESLNVAIAASIMIYESVRQRVLKDIP